MQIERLMQRAELAAAGIDRPDRLRSGVVDRARRGVYASGSVPTASRDAAYLRRILAADLTLTGPRVYSHESAAALLGLPVLGRWPEQVHLIGERRTGGRSQLDVVRHCLGLENVPTVQVGDLTVTSPARTAFDVALTRPFESGVTIADAVLARVPTARAELEQLLASHFGRRGHARAAAVIAFADGASGSPGESISRVAIHRLGFVAPELQVGVVTDDDLDIADFGWPVTRTLGEFDGEVKYREDRYRRGGSVEDVVIREKNRENRMRRSCNGFARWDLQDLRQGRLEQILLAAGVQKRPPRPRSTPSRPSVDPFAR